MQASCHTNGGPLTSRVWHALLPVAVKRARSRSFQFSFSCLKHNIVRRDKSKETTAVQPVPNAPTPAYVKTDAKRNGNGMTQVS
jgi:hypothetical protein